MRLDFCDNRATSRGRVICCIRSLLPFLFFSFSFFSSFSVCRRIRASAIILTDRRSYNKLRNNNFISPNKMPFVLNQHRASPSSHPPSNLFFFSLVRLSVISLLPHFLHTKYFFFSYLVIVNNYHRKFVKQ